MAEGILKFLHGTRIYIDSTGVRASEVDGFAVAVMDEIGIETARGGFAKSMETAENIIEDIPFPVIIRPSFTMGGTGGSVAYNIEEFQEFAISGNHRFLNRLGSSRPQLRLCGRVNRRGKLHKRRIQQALFGFARHHHLTRFASLEGRGASVQPQASLQGFRLGRMAFETVLDQQRPHLSLKELRYEPVNH